LKFYRVFRTLSAHSYGQLITISSTLLLPTIAVTRWGAEGYGYWVSLSAVAQFFALSDLGASVALANQLCLKSNRTSEEAWMLVRAVIHEFIKNSIYASIIILMIAFAGNFYLVGMETEKLTIEMVVSFALLAFSQAFQPLLVIYGAIWRFKGKNEVGIFINNTIRLLEFAAITLTAMAGNGLLESAVVALIFKLIAVIIIIFHMRKQMKKKPPVEVSKLRKYIRNQLKQKKNIEVTEFRKESSSEVEPVKKAGHGFMLMTLSQQLSLQSPVLLISAILGPVQSAVFVSCRTLSRLPVQPLTVLLASINPELTDLIVKKQNHKLIRVVSIISLITVSLSLLIGILAVNNIDVIEKVWLKNKLTLDLTVLTILCIAASFYLFGQVINQALSAANQTRIQGRQYIIASITVTFLSSVLLFITHKTYWCAGLILASETLMALLVFNRFYHNLRANFIQ